MANINYKEGWFKFGRSLLINGLRTTTLPLTTLIAPEGEIKNPWKKTGMSLLVTGALAIDAASDYLMFASPDMWVRLGAALTKLTFGLIGFSNLQKKSTIAVLNDPLVISK